MVKPISSSPQPTTIKPDVEQAGVNAGKDQADRPNRPDPIYSAKAQHARRAEHAMSGEAWALKLQQQLDASKQTSVPTPYPNIASSIQKNESKK